MTLKKLEDFTSEKTGATYEIYRAIGAFDRQNKALYDSLYELGCRWVGNEDEIKYRFSCPEVGRDYCLGTADDIAYMAVDPKTNRAIADVLMFRDRNFPELGIYCYVHTREEHERQGICGELLRRSSRYFFITGGELIILHTEWPKAYGMYKRRRFKDWYGMVPKDPKKDPGMVMLKKSPSDKRSLKEIVNAPFNGSGELCVDYLTRADSAQFLLLCSAYRDVSDDYQKSAVRIPALGVNDGCNAEDMFIKQFLLRDSKDFGLALKTYDNRLVGVFALTHPNRALGRERPRFSVVAHKNFVPQVEEMLKIKLTDGLLDMQIFVTTLGHFSRQ